MLFEVLLPVRGAGDPEWNGGETEGLLTEDFFLELSLSTKYSFIIVNYNTAFYLFFQDF